MTNKDWLAKEPFTLAFSSGFFGFYAHAGFLAALLKNGLKPKRVTGSSAGSIVAAIHASGHPIEKMKEILFSIRRQDFWDPSPGLGLLKGRKFEQTLATLLPKDFEQLATPLAISTFDVRRMQTKVFEKGEDLILAVRASCALPGLFQPVRHAKHFLIDGGVADDMAIQAIDKNERVLSHYLQKKTKPNFFERFQLRRAKDRPHLKILAHANRVFVSPLHLHQGEAAFQEAFDRTEIWLHSKAD